jgi:hypothetical protein
MRSRQTARGLHVQQGAIHCDTRGGDWQAARKLALKNRQAPAAVQASMGKARILGLIIDRREVGDPGAFDGFTDEQLVEEAAKRARALGIAGPRLVEDDK